MALIGKIRENSWFLIVLLVLGMGGFLFMDMFGGSRGSSVLGNQNLVAKVEGKKVRIDEFQLREQYFNGPNAPGDIYERRDNFWNYFVEEAILQNESKETGMGVSPTELNDLLRGPNYSPIVMQEFRNNLEQVSVFLDRNDELDPQTKASWFEFETRVVNDKLQSKLNNLVSKGLYTPTWLAEEVHRNNNTTVNIAYVSVPFSSIDISGVEVSDSEIKEYLSENKAVYELKEPTRSIEYVTFEVLPTSQDSTAIRDRIGKKAEEFIAAEDDSTFIQKNGGEYFTEYRAQDEFKDVIADSLMNVEIGTVLGPYLVEGEGTYVDYGFYRTTKVIDRKVVPDSVEARHIFFRVENPQFNPDLVKNAIAKADSFKTQILEQGIPFDTIALYNSEDESNKRQGGSLGMIDARFGGANPQSMMDFDVRDHIFYEATPNELDIIVTKIGVHLIEVINTVNTGKVGLRTASVDEVIIPSEATQNKIYNEAFGFIGKNRDLDNLKHPLRNWAFRCRQHPG